MTPKHDPVSPSVTADEEHQKSPEPFDEVDDHDVLYLSDAENPRKWAPGRKWAIVAVISFMSFTLTMGSSITSPAVFNLVAYFQVSQVEAVLSLSLYILGVSFGPLIFGPLSEVYGRNVIFYPTWFLFTVFAIPSALAKNLATHVIGRFFQGVFGSPALTVAGGTLTDIFEAQDLGVPLGLYSMMAFLGPTCGPIVGGWLTQGAPGGELESWRWTQWVLLMLAGVLGLNLLWMPETYAPAIDAKKRKNVSVKEIHQAQIGKKIPLWRELAQALYRPFELLLLDPIVLLMSLYMSVIYGILYIYFAAYDVVFMLHYNWNTGPTGLAFLGIGLGVLISLPTNGYGQKVLYMKLKQRRIDRGHPPLYPEARLPLAIVGSILAPISAFWFAWSGYTGDVHWIAPVLSGVPFGWSMVTIFVCLIGYLGEAYSDVSASCLAAATVLRSLFAFSFPLFTPTLYEHLGSEWAGSLLGFLLVGFAPIPLLFYKYGPWLRSKSRFASKAIVVRNE